ncbi:MAG: hypothetical protein JKY14_00130 [Paraglaciecola sp.]|nr:hypothetical protein [Paraglaciecola sp.]
MSFKTFLFCFIFSAHCFAADRQVFTFINKNVNDEIRHSFTAKVLDLALERTKDEYGDYQIIPSKAGVTVGRLQLQMKERNDNYFYKVSITDELLKDFHAIEFPIDRGIVSYRVGIINTKNVQLFKNVSNSEGLKKYLLIQGQGWLDNDIFKHNGLTSFAVATKRQCLDMISLNRADIYFRGLSEISFDIKRHEKRGGKLNVQAEPYIALFYPMPKFLITAKTNIENANRVEEGLKRAYEDGSFIKLWEEHNLRAIQSQNLNNRRVIVLENPFIKSLNDAYKKYNYKIPGILGL